MDCDAVITTSVGPPAGRVWRVAEPQDPRPTAGGSYGFYGKVMTRSADLRGVTP